MESKARVLGYLIADGTSVVGATPFYSLRLGGSGLATYVAERLSVAGVAGVTTRVAPGGDTVFEFPVAAFGRFYVSERGVPFPYDPPALLAGEPVYPADYGSSCRMQHFLAGILELDGAQGTTYPKTNQVLDDPHAKKRDALIGAYRALGATTMSAVGQSVVMQAKDFPIAQCLPVRGYGRVPGGAPSPTTCRP